MLKGAAIFLSDLARQVELDATFDFIGVSSYGNRPSPTQELKSGWDSTGEVKADQRRRSVDEGQERDRGGRHSRHRPDADGISRRLLMAHQPQSLKIAALLDKPSRRKLPLEGDYVGFKIPDEFVVGYGLDYAEKYRNLADICVVPRE